MRLVNNCPLQLFNTESPAASGHLTQACNGCQRLINRERGGERYAHTHSHSHSHSNWRPCNTQERPGLRKQLPLSRDFPGTAAMPSCLPFAILYSSTWCGSNAPIIVQCWRLRQRGRGPGARETPSWQAHITNWPRGSQDLQLARLRVWSTATATPSTRH